jgi:hypothetical protein
MLADNGKKDLPENSDGISERHNRHDILQAGDDHREPFGGKTGSQVRLKTGVINTEHIVGEHGDDYQHHVAFDVQTVADGGSCPGYACRQKEYRFNRLEKRP